MSLSWVNYEKVLKACILGGGFYFLVHNVGSFIKYGTRIQKSIPRIEWKTRQYILKARLLSVHLLSILLFKGFFYI